MGTRAAGGEPSEDDTDHLDSASATAIPSITATEDDPSADSAADNTEALVPSTGTNTLGAPFGSAPGGPADGSTVRSTGRSARLAVTAATLVFFATCLAFLMNTPTGFAPDEPYQFDRVMAAWNGAVILDPEEINMSLGSRSLETEYFQNYMNAGTPTFADQVPALRDDRLSYAELGGNTRSPKADVSNYMTQHPPLYYGLMGGLTWLVPGAADMNGDLLYLIVRFFNVLLLIPLPVLFWFAAKQLVGNTPVAAAAAFLPLLVPGLARGAATINNDNLAVVIGAAVVGLSLAVMRGDRSTRTAALLAMLAVAGALTKATVLFILVIIPIAYLTQVVRSRSWPKKSVVVILVVGGLCASAWWVRNYLRFGVIQPDGWGTQFATAQGPVRPPDVPVDMDAFWNILIDKIPSRFFGALGLLDPPQLPYLMVWSLVWLTLGCLVIAVVALPGRRWEVAVIAAVPLASLAMVCLQIYLHYVSYLAFTGVQGRYAYPSIFGLLFPIAVVAGLVLGRLRRWAPMLVLAGGLVVSGWALYVSVEYIWLDRGEQLEPSTWTTAIKNLGGYFPLPGTATVALGLTIVCLFATGFVWTVAACRHDARESQVGGGLPTA